MNANIIFEMQQSGTTEGRIFIGIFFAILLVTFIIAKVKVNSYSTLGKTGERRNKLK